jgi:hypothetical protein
MTYDLKTKKNILLTMCKNNSKNNKYSSGISPHQHFNGLIGNSAVIVTRNVSGKQKSE